MKKLYDRFADEYIDENEKSPYAPPERYAEITEEILIENAARWFLTALKRLIDEEAEQTEQEDWNCAICEQNTEKCVYCIDGNNFKVQTKSKEEKYKQATYSLSKDDDEWYCHYLICNECGTKWMCSETNFCPHCGANVINQSELTF